MSLFAELPIYVWLPALFILLTPIEVGFVIFLISRLAGWTDWAQSFPAGPVAPSGTLYPWCSARIGKLNARYGKLLAVTVSSAGLHVAPRLFIKVFHPPLLLPWTCVRSIGEGRVMGRTDLELACEADGRVLKLYLPLGAAGTVSSLRPAA